MTNEKLLLVFGVALVVLTGTFLAFQSQNHSNSSTQDLSLEDSDLKRYFSYVEDLPLRLREYRDWMTKYRMQYSRTEKLIRFKTWLENYNIVQEHNAKNLSWTLEMNMFAGETREEFAALHLGFRPDLENPNEYSMEDSSTTNAVNIPTSVDWRTNGSIGTVRNQGQCGGCWAFASCCALEALYFIKGKGALPNFSEQQLIDCSGDYGNQGCNGGTMVATFQYTQAYGVQTEASYPFIAQTSTCKYNAAATVFKNTGYKSVTRNSYTALQIAVAGQPTTVAVQADQSVFQLYRSGIISSGCGTGLNHAITAVGYSSTSYWIVRNSWGSSWGESGYVRIAMGSQNSGAGVCGINSMNSYPTVT